MNNGSLDKNPGIPETSDRCLQFLDLDHDPFSLAPDIVNFLSLPRIDTIIVEVLQLVEARMGFALLYGEVGLGKTTISRRILLELDRRDIETALVFNSFFQKADLIRAINRDFGVDVDNADLHAQLTALNDFLLERRRQRKNCVIIIDDAQNLTVESLELVRQISNMETGIDKIVQIILIGQSELEATLNRHELRQLKSRIVLKRSLKALSRRETGAYIRSKIARGGTATSLEIDNAAIRRIHDHSKGIPRRINVVMGRCLYAAVACNTRRITDRVARMAIQDLDEIENTASIRKHSRRIVVASLLGMLIVGPIAFAIVVDSRFSDGRSWRETQTTAEESAPRETIAASTIEVTPSITLLGDVEDSDRHTPELHAQNATDDPVNEVHEFPEQEPPETTIPHDQPVRDFLVAHGLEHHLAAFSAALSDKDFTAVANDIAATDAFQLVILPASIELPGNNFQALQLGDNASQNTLKVVLWRPQFWHETDFRFFYGKQQIMALQSALHTAGSYDYAVDGIAGERTATAIKSFQRQTRIPVSGVPDTATLFMLEVLGLTDLPSRMAQLDNAQ